MEIGLCAESLSHLSLAECLRFGHRNGFTGVVFSTGIASDTAHLDILRLLASKERRANFTDMVGLHGLKMTALYCPGNPLAAGDDGVLTSALLRHTIRLAALLGVEQVISSSGSPIVSANDASEPEARLWAARFALPDRETWLAATTPFWRSMADHAAQHNVRLCLAIPGADMRHVTDYFNALRRNSASPLSLCLDLHLPGFELLARPNLLADIGHVAFDAHGLQRRLPTRASWHQNLLILSQIGYTGGLTVHTSSPSAEATMRNSALSLRRATEFVDVRS